MFEKFKRFGIMFLLCMGVFGTSVFASEKSSVELLGSSDYSYYLSYIASDGDNVTVLFNEFGGSWVYDGELFYNGVSQGVSSLSVSDDYLYYNTNNSQVRSYLVSLGKKIDSSIVSMPQPGGIIPPSIPPTSLEAIQTIVPQLSTQLGILLPIGVIILSIMLGVSLVPRLVHLFL